MAVPPELTELLEYFEPFSMLRRDLRGAATLLTPGVNVLALNAAYLPAGGEALLPLLAIWQREHGTPPLIASVTALPGEDVGGVRVGTYLPQSEPGVIVVEQVSRLQVAAWAGVLAEAHGTPEWAGALTSHFGARLEGMKGAALLVAYAGGEAIGALLWRSAGQGGAAHLWGTLDPAADAPLLNMAAELGGGHLRASLPDTSPLTVTDEAVVVFTRPAGQAGPTLD